jgi:hypothetical protein
MAGFFQEFVQGLQLDLHLWQFAEDVVLRSQTFDGIVKVMESEGSGPGQSMIVRAEVLLKACQVETVRTTESIEVRGQSLQIETVAPVVGGMVKVTAMAKRKETTSLNGRR